MSDIEGLPEVRTRVRKPVAPARSADVISLVGARERIAAEAAEKTRKSTQAYRDQELAEVTASARRAVRSAIGWLVDHTEDGEQVVAEMTFVSEAFADAVKARSRKIANLRTALDGNAERLREALNEQHGTKP